MHKSSTSTTTVLGSEDLLWGYICEAFGIHILKGETKAAFRVFNHVLVHLENQ